MHVSYAEMMRNAPDMLRMIGGHPYGQAMEAVEAFMMTHAALDKGYALVRLASRTVGPWITSIDDSDPTTLKVDLGGAPLLLSGGILADAFYAYHATGGRRLVVKGTNGGWAAAYIAFRIARHGLACSATWLAERPAEDEAAALHIRARPPMAAQASVELWMEETSDAGGHGQGLSIEADEQADTPAKQGVRIDFEAGVRGFIINGRETDPAEYQRDFVAVAARIRVPFSERSRGQAG